MNPQDPLAGLHVLREPALVGWWPLAPGWWMLLALALLCLAGVSYWLVNRYRSNAYRRHALTRLQELHARHETDANTGRYLAEVNKLLKSVALAAYPRHQVASRHGEDWLAFLNGSLGTDDHFGEAFAEAAYRPDPAGLDPAPVYRSAQRWIRGHRATS